MRSLRARILGSAITLTTLVTTGVLVQPVAASPLYSSVVLADNPVAYYRLGESPARTTAVDSSPFGRNGTYVGPVTRGLPGAIVDDPNTAAVFPGSDAAAVSIPGAAFNFGNNFTLEAWVINDGGTGISRVISNRQTAGIAAGFGFGVLGDGRLRFTTFGIQDYDTSPGVVVPQDGQYHHVVVTFDTGNDAHFYVDGNFRQTVLGTQAARDSVSDLNIGRNPVASPITGSFEPWNGRIDEVAVYNYVLSAGQIANHFQAGIAPAGTAIPEPSAVALLGLGTLGLLGYAWRRRRQPA